MVMKAVSISTIIRNMSEHLLSLSCTFNISELSFTYTDPRAELEGALSPHPPRTLELLWERLSCCTCAVAWAAILLSRNRLCYGCCLQRSVTDAEYPQLLNSITASIPRQLPLAWQMRTHWDTNHRMQRPRALHASTLPSCSRQEHHAAGQSLPLAPENSAVKALQLCHFLHPAPHHGRDNYSETAFLLYSLNSKMSIFKIS